MKTLTREDIVGQRIRGAWQTPWLISGDWKTSDPILEMENGFAFALLCQDSFEKIPIEAIDLAVVEKIPMENGLIRECYGMKIAEVLESCYDPAPVILLENWWYISADAYYDGEYGPVRLDYLHWYSIDHVKKRKIVTYWEHHEAPWPELPLSEAVLNARKTAYTS